MKIDRKRRSIFQVLSVSPKCMGSIFLVFSESPRKKFHCITFVFRQLWVFGSLLSNIFIDDFYCQTIRTALDPKRKLHCYEMLR